MPSQFADRLQILVYPLTRFFGDRYSVALRQRKPRRETPPPVESHRTLSVAITHYENPDLAHVSLLNILRDPRIGEIVMLDDGSSSANFQRLKKRLAPFRPRLRLFRREKNGGILAAKIQAVSLCRHDWVLLLDCDNTILPEYLRALYAIPAWSQDSLYGSDFPFPQFDFRRTFSGKTLDWSAARSLAANKPAWPGALFNDANYVLNRERFLSVMRPHWATDAAGVDALLSQYLWMSRGDAFM